MKISSNYSIESLKPNLIGMNFRLVMAKQGSFKVFNGKWFNGVSDFILFFIRKRLTFLINIS